MEQQIAEQNVTARRNMLDSQIYTNKVENEFVLAALERIPREEFVPEALRGVAYIDKDLPLGDGRVLMEPMVFARLLESADIQKHEKVLVVGSATGYPVAVIAELAGEVIGLENNLNFISKAQANMKKLGLTNTAFVKADLVKGAERYKPFDVIFINGTVDQIPPALLAQVKDNGRIVTIKSDPAKPHGPYYAVLIYKNGRVVAEQKEFQAFTTQLAEFKIPMEFKF